MLLVGSSRFEVGRIIACLPPCPHLALALGVEFAVSRNEGSRRSPCQDMTNAHCPVASPARTLVVCVVFTKPTVVLAMAGTSHPCPLDRAGDRKWVEMEGNGTELKVLSLLATPDEAKRGQRGLTVAQCVRVDGGPNEAAPALFSASRPGVNEAKQGQMGPGINPPHSCHSSKPCTPARTGGGISDRDGRTRGILRERRPFAGRCHRLPQGAILPLAHERHKIALIPRSRGRQGERCP